MNMSDTTVEPKTAEQKIEQPKPPTPVAPQDEPVFIRVQLTEAQIEAQFAALFTRFSQSVNELARRNGFWETPNAAEKIALVHSELSEALEYLRKNPATPDDKIPTFTGVEAELADAIIRIMDFAEYYQLRVGEAIIAKHKFNAGRPYKHGKKF
jgi:NTP pyrophosphatase (non-canonical NTP hydrolase)